MLYLASQFAWFLLAAFALGFVMGWIGHDGDRLDLRSRQVGFAAALWLLAGAASWMQAVNGSAALWLETGLLFVAVYFAGCALASLLRATSQPALALGGMPASDNAAVAPVRTAPPLVAGGRSTVPDAETVAGSAGGLTKVEGEDAISGERPAGLAAARDGTPDDLKLIRGIGRQNEGRLHGLGIWHFDQIAAWQPENIEWIGGYLAFPGRIEREDWVGQAKMLAAGVETAFAKRAKAGEVASSRDDGTQGQGNRATLADGEFDGEKPGNLLAAARDGKPDDLTLLKGVGPVVAADLNRLGIWHFDQVASLKDAEIRYLCAFADIAVTTSQSWREDADILRHGGDTAHSRAVKAGRKPEG